MILVDRALMERQQQGNPIRVAIVGSGYSARTILHQIVHSVPGLRVVAVANRTVETARAASAGAGIGGVRTVETPTALARSIRDGALAVTCVHHALASMPAAAAVAARA